jgi:tryptophan 2,3-dioxygenase
MSIDIGQAESPDRAAPGGCPAALDPVPGYPPVLPGEGDDDYARYMRTGVLLALQRGPEEMIHRDELLFQIVHQSTELWLKHACFEVDGAVGLLRSGAPGPAARLMARACLGIELITGQLEMLRHLAPSDFRVMRPALGHGSGLESPGWRETRRVSRKLGATFDEVVALLGVDLVALYEGNPDRGLYRLAERMVEWDERIAVWRVNHYRIATRILGYDAVGTKGTPVAVLARLIDHRFFPRLWQVRNELTLRGPLGQGDGTSR